LSRYDRPRLGRRKNIKGFTFVGLMVLTTIVGLFAMAAHPLWQNVMRRAKEQELVFRGIQYADAIARFKREMGRAPLKLEELYDPEKEVKFIRQLYKDPMTEDGEWDIIYSFSGRGGRRRAGGTQQYSFESEMKKKDEEGGFGGGWGDDSFGNDEDDTDSGFGRDPFGGGSDKDEGSVFGGGTDKGGGSDFGGRAGGSRRGKGPRGGVGAIVGVRTVFDEESLLTWDGKTRYNEWLFVAGKVRDQNAGFGLASNLILPGMQPIPGTGQGPGGGAGGPPVSGFQGGSPSDLGSGAGGKGSKDQGSGFGSDDMGAGSRSPGGSKPGGRRPPGGGSKDENSRKGELY